jgi:hypothetical protein
MACVACFVFHMMCLQCLNGVKSQYLMYNVAQYTDICTW